MAVQINIGSATLPDTGVSLPSFSTISNVDIEVGTPNTFDFAEFVSGLVDSWALNGNYDPAVHSIDQNGLYSYSGGATTDLSGITVSATNDAGTATSNAFSIVTSITAPGGEITTMTVRGSGTGATLFGHLFREGDAPNGDVSMLGAQLNVMSTWPDGSAKMVEGAGILTGGQSYAFDAAAQSTGTNLGDTELLAALGTTTITLSGGASGSVNAADLVSGAATPLAPGKFVNRQGQYCYEVVVGGVLSGTIHGFFHCRVFSNGQLDVDFVIENAESITANANRVNGVTVTMVLAGSQVYNATHDIHANSRAKQTFVNTGTVRFCAPDRDYFYTTLATPYYGTDPANRQGDETVGMYGLGPFRDTFGDTGYDVQIGPLPSWDAAAIRNNFATEDINAVLTGADAINHRAVIHKDTATGYPVDCRVYTQADHQGWQSQLRQGSGGDAFGDSKSSHMPSAGYLAYILTGKRYYLETTWYWADYALMAIGTSAALANRGTGLTVFVDSSQHRQNAWKLRNIMQAAFISPDSHPEFGDGMKTSMVSSIDYVYNTYVTGSKNNQFRWYDSGVDWSQNNTRPWQHTWVHWVIFAIHQKGLGGSNSQAVADWQAVYTQKLVSDGDDTDWCWQDVPYSHDGFPAQNGVEFSTSWADFASDAGFDASCDLGGEFTSGNPGTATSYVANLRPMVAIAYELGFITQASHDRYMNGQPASADYDADPVWSAIGRSPGGVTLSPPVFTGTVSISPQEGVAGSYGFAQHFSNSPTSYTLTGTLPSGFTFDDPTGVLSWTNAITPGSASGLFVTATNADGNDDTGTFGFTIDSAVTGLPSWMPAVGAIAQIPLTNQAGDVVTANGGASYPGNNNREITAFWSGGAIVTLAGRPYLNLYGFGHNDGSWNGIVKIGPLDGDTMDGSIFLPPSDPSTITRDITPNSDGRQAASHTYNHLVGIGDTMYAMATDAYYHEGGFSSNDAYRFTESGQTQLATSPRDGYFGGACHHNGVIYVVVGGGAARPIYRYDIASDSWSNPGGSENFQNYVAIAVDSVSGNLLVSNGAETRYYNTTTNSFSSTLSNPPAFNQSIEYDPVRDTFVCHNDNSRTVYELSASSLRTGGTPSWSTRNFTGATPPLESNASGVRPGTFGRFRFLQIGTASGYIYLPNADSDIYFYRAN